MRSAVWKGTTDENDVIPHGALQGAGTEWVTAPVGRDLRNFGIADNPTIVLKSDQEPALVDLLKDVQ